MLVTDLARQEPHAYIALEEAIRRTRPLHEEAQEYLVMRCGKIPLMAVLESGVPSADTLWYMQALVNPELEKDAFGLRWYANLLLPDGGLLSWERMSGLLEDRTWKSRTIDIEGRFRYEEFRDTVERLYEGITPEDAVRAIPDLSDRVLEERCVEALGELTRLKQPRRTQANGLPVV